MYAACSVALWLAIYVTIEGFFLLFNRYVDPWYVGILFLCFIPIYIACVLFWSGAFAYSKKDRAWLKWACLLVIISVLLFTIWSIVYFEKFYRYKYVYHGIGDPDEFTAYSRQTKKDYVIQTSILGAVYLGAFIYFFIVCWKWQEIGAGE